MACATSNTCGSRSLPACCRPCSGPTHPHTCNHCIVAASPCCRHRARRLHADRTHRPADVAVDMMDNASALPTCPQRQQQKKIFRKSVQNHPHDFTKRQEKKLNAYRCRSLRRDRTCHHHVDYRALLSYLGLSQFVELMVKVGRWPILVLVISFAIAVIYRYGPSRDKPKWQWVSPGCILATVLWHAASLLFSWYAENFGSYKQDIRVSRRRDRLHDLALDIDNRHPARGKIECRA